MARNGLIARVLVVVAASGVFAAARAADEKGAVGTWKLKVEAGDGLHEPVLTVTKAESNLKGEYVDGDQKVAARDVRFEDGKLRFTVVLDHDGAPATARYEGKVDGDAIKGEGQWEFQGMNGSFSFEGKREAAKPGD